VSTAAPTHRWQTGTVASGGEYIYFEVVGNDDDAPAVVLTHGAGGSHAAWFQQVPVLADAGYRVITWDCRGFGRSSFRTEVHGADAAVTDMKAVLETVDVDRAHLVGQSMGGWWVTAFTVDAPARVRSLSLTNTVGGLWTEAIEEHFTGYVRNVQPEGPRVGAHDALSRSFVARDPARAFLYQQLNTFHTPPMAAVVGSLFSARVDHAALDALDIPILMITGSDDQLFPAPLIADSASRLKNASLVEIADAGHSPYFERPDEWNDALLRFLEKAS
jgi:pimeloyl-ACP methyl ester carboxylesterase